MRIYTRIAILVIILAGFTCRTHSQEWIVPEDQKAVVASFTFTPDIQKQGEQLYNKNCQSCHGIPGKDNWAKLTPPPGDLSKEKAQKQSDGEWFYKITAGKAPMPEFRNILSEDERWWIIAYLRTYNAGYKQPDPASKVAFAGRSVTLAMKYDDAQKKVVVNATELSKEKTTVAAAGVEVMLMVKRYFGYMQVGEIRSTNGAGIAQFDFPTDLPGDAQGFVELQARVNDPKGLMRSQPATGSYAIGVPTLKPALTDTRAWWSVRMKAPVWVILTYTLSVVIVWGFIFYILYTILKIRTVGKQ
jgi:mono/diheme cytochrome c family protein